MALGARPEDILRMALADSLRLGGLGLVIGLPVALAIVRVMSNALYGVMRIESPVFIGLSALLFVCAALAGYVPAVRASRVDPLKALRTE